MQRARALDGSQRPVPGRGAEQSAPRPEPLTLVSGAVAGEDLQSVAATVAHALQCPVAIVIAALGQPVVHPPDALSAEATGVIAVYAAAVGRGESRTRPDLLSEAVPVRIGDQIVGIVAAVGDPGAATANHAERLHAEHERHAWLEAAAAAASVTALIREADGGLPGSGQSLVADLAAAMPDDVPAFVARARRLGLELGAGGVAIGARGPRPAAGQTEERPTIDAHLLEGVCGRAGALAAILAPERIVAIAPLDGEGSTSGEQLAETLRGHGLIVAVSAPRRDPAQLHGAVREALLLAELGTRPGEPGGQDETYRLLIGVLLHDADELALLRDRTISPLADYDGRHDTELVATLRAFLAHDGSTTETADAMSLHRHTVGYRLSRVHEVSGLSPYESDGRERLSLGLKAHDILEARDRLDVAR